MKKFSEKIFKIGQKNKSYGVSLMLVLWLVIEKTLEIIGVFHNTTTILGLSISVLGIRIGFILLSFGVYIALWIKDVKTHREKVTEAAQAWTTILAPNKENNNTQKYIPWLGGLLLLLLISAWLLTRPTPNQLNRYTFEPNDPTNACWRVRTDQDGQPLGVTAVSSKDANRLGKSALAFSLTLPNPYYDSTHLTIGQQIDLKTDAKNAETSLCSGTWEIPYDGRMQAWLCLPDTPEAENRDLTAEFFIQMENGNWNASAPVLLERGKWVKLIWNAEHDKTATWRNWTETLDYTSRANAFGIEIKLDENSPQQDFSGTIYIDEVVILKDAQPYSIAMMKMDKYIHTNGCP